MKKQEAEKVITILLAADGGCIVCARALVLYFCTDFPQFASLARKMYEAEYGEVEDWNATRGGVS